MEIANAQYDKAFYLNDSEHSSPFLRDAATAACKSMCTTVRILEKKKGLKSMIQASTLRNEEKNKSNLE